MVIYGASEANCQIANCPPLDFTLRIWPRFSVARSTKGDVISPFFKNYFSVKNLVNSCKNSQAIRQSFLVKGVFLCMDFFIVSNASTLDVFEQRHPQSSPRFLFSSHAAPKTDPPLVFFRRPIIIKRDRQNASAVSAMYSTTQ